MCLIFFSCTTMIHKENQDTISKLINTHRTGEMQVLFLNFGQPSEIEKTKESDVERYIYNKTLVREESFEVFVDSKNKKVLSSSIFLWKSDDDYELLKKRFNQFKWIETFIPTKAHPLQELYRVEIPELGISFEYDRLAPKVMWIFFNTVKK